jgi:cytochrome c5
VVKRNCCFLAAVLFGVATGVTVAAQSQQASKSTSKASSQSAVTSIVLPQYPVKLPPGPHQDAFAENCQICHSARYVAMQPRFTQAVWQSEVKKMVDAYGAQIPEATQHEIVEYLVATHGMPATK